MFPHPEFLGRYQIAHSLYARRARKQATKLTYVTRAEPFIADTLLKNINDDKSAEV